MPENAKEKGKVGKGRPPEEHRFKPGWEGGPGRPQGCKGLKATLKELLEAGEEKQTKQLMQATILNAAKGNGTALKLIWDVIEGPVAQKTEVRLDLSVLTDEELETLYRLQCKIDPE